VADPNPATRVAEAAASNSAPAKAARKINDRRDMNRN
jgi:hypothetical protein